MARREDLRGQARLVGILLRDVRNPAAGIRLLAQIARSRVARSAVDVVIPLCDFELEVRLSEGEIAPYGQIADDIRAGVIPRGPGLHEWTVVDCGANVGLFSLFFREAARIIAVEPNPGPFERLQRNLERNVPDGTAVPKAVSDREGAAAMQLGEGPSVLGRLDDRGTTPVPVTTIDALVRDHHIDRVDLLKLDVEGHELEALAGAQGSIEAGRIRRIFAEHSDATTLRDLDRLLFPLGYERTATSQLNALYERSAGAA